MYNMPIDERIFQDVRIEIMTTERLHIPFEDSSTPTNVLHHFRTNFMW